MQGSWGRCALDGSVHRSAGDAEEFGDVRAGVPASTEESDKVLHLRGGELGLPDALQGSFRKRVVEGRPHLVVLAWKPFLTLDTGGHELSETVGSVCAVLFDIEAPPILSVGNRTGSVLLATRPRAAEKHLYICSSMSWTSSFLREQPEDSSVF